MSILLPSILKYKTWFFTLFLFLVCLCNTGFSQTVYVAPSGNDITGNGTISLPFATIQAAINAASSGNDIVVAAGTYAERIIVNKPLTITGPNTGLAGADASRVAEAKIVPPTTNFGSNTATLLPVVKFTSGSAGSVFDGFEVNGDNSALPATGVIAGGVNVDAAFGIYIENTGDVAIKNNLVQNFGSNDIATYGYPYAQGISAVATNIVSGIVISSNYIKNINQASPVADLNGIMIVNDTYSQVLNNKIESVRNGIQFLNGHRPNPNAATFPALIDGNDISSYRSGIYYNLQNQTASPWIVRNNTIQSATSSAPGTSGNNFYEGIRVESIRNTVNASIISNTIIGNEADRLAEDATYRVWGIGFKNGISTTGTFMVKDNDISLVKHGIVYLSESAHLTTKIKFRGGNIHNVSGDYVRYEITGGTPTFTNIDLPTTKLDGKTGSEYTITELANIKATKITDKDDDARFGMVNFILPVRNLTKDTYFTSIQASIDDAETVNGDVINVDAGTYTLTTGVNVTKGVTIQGNILNLVDKPIITGVGGVTNKALFYITVPNVTIQNLHLRFQEQNASSGSSTISYGIRTGVNGTFNNLKILDNVIEGTNSTYVFNSYGISTGAQTNPSVLTDQITIQRNVIGHTVANNALGRAIRTWFSYGTIGGSQADNNNLKGHYASIQASRPGGSGSVIISFNDMQGKVEINGFSTGVHRITGNNITSGGNADAQEGKTAADRQPALIEVISSPVPASSLEIAGNTFTDFKLYGIAVFSSNNVSILNNTFNPLANAAAFTHVYFDTKTSNTNYESPETSTNLVVKGNQFNSSGIVGGKGLLFANSNGSTSLEPLTGAVIGGAGAEANTFSANLSEYINLANNSGSSELISPWEPTSVFYSGTAVTTAYPFSSDIEASQNNFGGIEPSTATNADLYALETKINHGVDNGLTGFVTIKAATAFPATAAETQNTFDVVPDENYTVLVKAGTDLTMATLTASKDITLGSEDAGINLSGMTMNGAGKTLTLAKPVNLSGALTLTSGVLATSVTNILHLAGGATFSSPVVNAYIDGPVTKDGGGSIIFPVGKAGITAPIEVAGVDPANVITAEYFKTAFSDVTTIDGAITHGISLREYWSVLGTDVSNQITPTLWSFDEQASGISNIPGLVVAAYNSGSSTWESLGALSASANPVNVTSSLPTSATILTFGATTSQGFTTPNISSINLPANGRYKNGDVLEFIVNFSSDVTVTGTPQLAFDFSPSNPKQAAFVSNNGSGSLTFHYTIQTGDLSSGLTVSSLTGTIEDAASGNTADLTLYSTNASAGILVDAVVPVISSISIPNTPMKVGSTVTATITTTSDPDTYMLGSGSIGGFALTNLSKINNTTYRAVFSVTEGGSDIAAGNNIPVSLVVSDPAGNQSASYTSPIAQNADLIDANTPVIASVSLPANGTYSEGQNLNFTVTYSEPVTVSGLPLINLTVGSSAKTAAYVSRTGADLLFRYTVQAGDLDIDGLTINLLSGGIIADAAGNISGNILNAGSSAGIKIDAVLPIITANQIFTVGENSVAGTAVGTVAGSDPGSSNTLQNWTIISGNVNNIFAVDPSTGVITVNNAILDYETRSSYTLNLTVSDGNNSSAAESITINLADGNEIIPVIAASQTFNIDENSAVETIVGTVQATDGDAITTTFQNWTITGGNINNAFKINSSTGDLQVNQAVLDFENINSYTLTLTVSDGVNTSAPQTITINVNDLPEAPGAINLIASTLYENQASGTLAAKLSSASGKTYSLVTGTGDTDNNLFVISNDELKTAAVLNYENKSSYHVRIRSTAQSGSSVENEFEILIQNVNESPTLAAIADQVLCYTTALQKVGLSGISSGEDSGQSTILSLSTDNSALFESLTINGNEVNYRIKEGASGSGIVTVTVKDNGGTDNGGIDSYSRNFTITVNPAQVVVITSDYGTELSKGQIAQLTATGGTSYQWESAEGIISGQQTAVLTIRPLTTTTYRVTVTNANGCNSVQEITIIVKDDYRVQANNIMSPNGDGINDLFVIKNIDIYPNNTLKIFDRAGRVIYSKKNYSNDWNGTLNESYLAEDTYFYILDFGTGVQSARGFITIVKN